MAAHRPKRYGHMSLRAAAPGALPARGPRPWLRHERFADLPNAYRIYLILQIGAVAVGCAIAAPRADPALAAIIAAAMIIAYGFAPITPGPGGGILTFDMPTRYSVALLFDPATVFIGIAAGVSVGSWLVHRREPWRAMANGALAALSGAVAAAASRWLLHRAGLAFAMVVAPTVVVALGHVVNEALSAVRGYCRHGLAIWPEFMASFAEHIGDHALDIVFLMPVAAGALLVAPRWWPGLLLVSFAMTGLNVWFMVSQLARSSEGRTTVASQALPSDDPLLKRVADDLGQGVGLLTADGVLLGMTVAGSLAFGRRQLPADTRLTDLCLPIDVAKVTRALVQACRTTDEVAVDVRPANATDAPQWLRLAFINRLYDPSVHRIIVTIRSLAGDAALSQRLRDYADHALAGQIIAAQEQERTRIAQELENNIGQVLTVVRSLLERVEHSAARPGDPRKEC